MIWSVPWNKERSFFRIFETDRLLLRIIGLIGNKGLGNCRRIGNLPGPIFLCSASQHKKAINYFQGSKPLQWPIGQGPG
jgi:hypothetical protein